MKHWERVTGSGTADYTLLVPYIQRQLSWVEQGLTSTRHSIGYFGDDVLQVWWPNQ